MEGIPAIGPPRPISAHLDRCPLCGGPNPGFDAAAPVPIRSPRIEVQEPPQFGPPPSIAVADADVPQLVRTPRSVKIQPPHQQRPPEAWTPPVGRPAATDVLDNPVIGGKLTVCVLCYGDHENLARKCLGSILATLPRARMDLRVATNAACPGTLQYLREEVRPDRLYVHERNMYKYPVMRQLFWDPQAPLTTRYLTWFDDDTECRDPQWASKLGQSIVVNHRRNVRLYGTLLHHDLTSMAKPGHSPQAWFLSAPWFRGVHWRIAGTKDVRGPNGSCIDFASGWWWCIGTDALRACDVPDRRLGHNGGDVTIGAQLLQGGFRMLDINRGKRLVWCPEKHAGGRRGYSEAFPWADPARRAAHVPGR